MGRLRDDCGGFDRAPGTGERAGAKLGGRGRRTRRQPGRTERLFPCGAPSDVTEPLIHETQTSDFSLSRQRRVDRDRNRSVHFVVNRTGEVTQHNDLVDRLFHAGQHNPSSVGIEVVNPFSPAFAHGGLDDWPRIERTTWGARDDGANPHRTYVLPERKQCEAVTRLVEWLSEPHEHDGGVVWPGVPGSWVGLDDRNRLLFGFDSEHRSPSPVNLCARVLSPR